MQEHLQAAAEGAHEAAHSDGMAWLARAGYATKGLLYVTLGALSVHASIAGGSPEDSQGAIQTIGQQPFGVFLLVAVSVGLAGYALWRVIQAVLDPEQEGDDLKGVAKRIGYGISAVIHASLCMASVQLVLGSRGSSGGGTKQTYLAELMTSTAGQVAVGIAGAVVIGFGAQQLLKAWKADIGDSLDFSAMSPRERRVATIVGRLGLAARGVVFPIIGIYIVRAALTTDPSEAKGLQGALTEISTSTFGAVMLFVVATGLTAYGAYQFVQARYRRLPMA